MYNYEILRYFFRNLDFFEFVFETIENKMLVENVEIKLEYVKIHNKYI